MDPGEGSALHAFVREHHVHYEVQPEEVEEGRRRALVALRLRLLATHPREKLAVPGCPACAELLGELRSFADRFAAEAGLDERAETIPAARKLYESEEDRGADEVAVTLRIHCDAPEDRRPGDDNRTLAAVRERLAALGVPRT